MKTSTVARNLFFVAILACAGAGIGQAGESLGAPDVIVLPICFFVGWASARELAPWVRR